jgi:hypothetical protein
MGLVYNLPCESDKKVTCILRLGKGNSFLGLQYLEAKEIMQIT